MAAATASGSSMGPKWVSCSIVSERPWGSAAAMCGAAHDGGAPSPLATTVTGHATSPRRAKAPCRRGRVQAGSMHSSVSFLTLLTERLTS